MYGNGLHEAFVYFEVPTNIKFSAQTDTQIWNSDKTTMISETSTAMADIGTGGMFIFKAGVRNDFNYVTTAFKYENTSKSFNLTSPMPKEFLQFPGGLEGAGPIFEEPIFLGPYTGEMYENNYRIIAGINIKPVWVITIPVEYEYYLSDLKTAKDGPDFMMIIEKTIRVGLELKPASVFSFRGGISYDTIMNRTPLTEPGTPSNPIQYLTGYHAGIGLELPAFEWNITALLNRFNSSPKDTATLTRYYMAVFMDMNFYM